MPIRLPGIQPKATDQGRQTDLCDGPQGGQNPYFSKLPMPPNKGEALVVEIPGCRRAIFTKNRWPSFRWKRRICSGSAPTISGILPTKPSEQFYRDTEALLKQWLKIPSGLSGTGPVCGPPRWSVVLCRPPSPLPRDRHIEWDGNQGLFTGALFSPGSSAGHLLG